MSDEVSVEQVMQEMDDRPWIWKEGHTHRKSITANYDYKIKIAHVRNGFIVEQEPCMPTYIFKTLDEVLSHLLFVFEGRKVRGVGGAESYGKVVIERGCCDEGDCCI